MITPYGFCPLPLPVHYVQPPHEHCHTHVHPAGYASAHGTPPWLNGREYSADADVARAKAACPPGFTLKPAAEVYKECQGLLQKKRPVESHSFDQPNVPAGMKPGDAAEAAPAGLMLEGLLPNGRQREPRLDSEDTSRKVFVGGLNPSTTSGELRTYFERFGAVSDALVVTDKVRRISRGFGFVLFEGEIPAGLLEMQHIIGNRRCGVRDYGGGRENELST
jgi:hypothetical protein